MATTRFHQKDEDPGVLRTLHPSKEVNVDFIQGWERVKTQNNYKVITVA